MENKKTIKTILTNMRLAVESNTPKPPSQWIDWAIQLNVLWQDLKDEMTKYEMLYKQEISDNIESGKKVSESELLVESKSENYKMYRYLKGRDEIISEFIKLAKSRAKIENTYEY